MYLCISSAAECALALGIIVVVIPFEKLRGYLQMQTTDIEQEVRTYLTENFLFGRGEILTDEVPLLGNVIDSTGVIELIVFLQERFTIAVDDEEVTTDNLGSVKHVVAFVEEKLRRQL
jgi:acyl carrier protein